MHETPTSFNEAGKYINRTALNWWFSVIILTYVLSALVVANYYPPKYTWHEVAKSIVSAYILAPLLAGCAYVAYIMMFIRPAHLTRYIICAARSYMTRERIFYAMPAVILFPIFISTFTFYKSIIPQSNPYSWDLFLAHADLIIHGGVHPWKWLQPLIGFPPVTALINFSYHIWFVIIFSSFYWSALSTSKPILQMQFLFSFVLSWIILGNVVATAFSSVGPCFFDFIAQKSNPYAPLMQYLHDANNTFPIWALEVQKLLWDEHQSGKMALGISAMPSMHVASAVLVALLSKNISKMAGIAGLIFAVIIMIGSIHLGWHYAVDGYIGAIGAASIWRLVGWLINKKYLKITQAPGSAYATPDEMQGMKV